MPDPISWYALGRTISDPTTIMEAIDQKILEHNQDPGAHGFNDEALYLHRNQYLIDHLNYSIYNIKLNPASRPIKAFVDVGGAAEFSDIQKAIDYVSSLGGGKIVIKAGVYNLNSSIYLKSNISLVGENAASTILRFNVSSPYPGYGVKAIGDNSPYSTGTVSVNYNSKTVTGSGTAFLSNVSSGDYIRLNGVWYEIASVDSDTQLTLKNKYLDFSLSGASYVCASFIEDVLVQDLTIEGTAGKIFNEFKYVSRGTFKNINGGESHPTELSLTNCVDSKIEDCDLVEVSMGGSSYCHLFQNNSNYPTGVIIDDCFDSTIIANVISGSESRGIHIRDSKRVVLSASFISVYDWEAIKIENCSNVIVNANNLISQGPGNAPGIIFDSTHYSILVNNNLRKSWSTGVSFIASCFNRLLGNSTENVSGYSVKFDSNSHYNLLSGHLSFKSSSGLVQDLGVGNKVGSDNLAV